MLVALDLTGDVITYAYFDGSEVVTEELSNMKGFRTKDLFKVDGAITSLLRVVKDMIGFAGVTVTESIVALPAYCNYAERERVKNAAVSAGMSAPYMIRGSLASALTLFQTTDMDKKDAVLCSVHSNYAEMLLFSVDGDVFRVLGATSILYEGDAVAEDPEKLQKRIRSELKALYSEQGLTMGEKDEEIYISIDENAGTQGEAFTEILGECYETTPTEFENDAAQGAFYQLMKREDFRCDTIRKCFLVDCSVEGISIGSGVGGEIVEVCKRNVPLPVKTEVCLPVSFDNVLCFYAGNYRNREYDEPIGTCRIPGQYRTQNVHVKITLNEDGIVEYSVLDASRQVIYPRQKLN